MFVLWKCSGCGRTERHEYTDAYSWRNERRFCSCGGRQHSHPVIGKLSSHLCDARCTSAAGPNCECSCAGTNHGRDHAIR